MSIWGNLFGKSDKADPFDRPLPDHYEMLVRKAIDLIGRDDARMENKQLIAHLSSRGIPEFEAGELIIFLPTAFCRRLLPTFDWPLYYLDYYSDKKKIRRKYTDNKRYVIMQAETEKYWSGTTDRMRILSIAGRSAEFQAINDLLVKHSGNLVDVKITEQCVERKAVL